jgi:predicted peroxiredoxin
MKSILFGNGYWAYIVKKKIIDLTDLVMTYDSKTITDIPHADIAFICSSTNSHYEVIKRCMDSGIKYLFCTKPFTGNYEKAKELFDIAERKGVNIFVDNLFLYRKEISNIQLKNVRDIFFHWHKPDLREDYFNSLLYHDLYLLSKWSMSDKWKASYVFDESFYLKLENPFQTCRFRYIIGKEHKKWVDIDNYIIDLSYPENDPLQECIVKMINGSIDYQLSREVTLSTLKLMNNIQRQLR